MGIQVLCDECFEEFDVAEKYAGRTGKCPACNASVRVPKESSDGPDSYEPQSPVRRKRKKKKATGTPVAKTKHIEPSRVAQLLTNCMERPLIPLIGCGVIGVVLAAVFIDLPFTGRSQKTFQGEHGSPRTTSEWLALARENETSEDRSLAGPVLRRRRLDGIEQFLGADPAALPDLFEALTVEQSRLPQIAESVLAKFTSGADRPLLEDLSTGLRHEHPVVRRWSLRLLTHLGDDGHSEFDRVVELTLDQNQAVSRAAISTVSTMGDRAVPVLKNLLTSEQPLCVLDSIRALGDLGESAEPVIPDLIALLDGDERNLVLSSAAALGKIGPVAAPAIPKLIECLPQFDRDGDEQIGAALLACGTDSVGPLGKIVREPESESFRAACYILNQFGETAGSVIDDIVAGLETADEDAQEKLLRVIGSIGSKATAALPAFDRFYEPPGKLSAHATRTALTVAGDVSQLPMNILRGTIIAARTDVVQKDSVVAELARRGSDAVESQADLMTYSNALETQIANIKKQEANWKKPQILIVKNFDTGKEHRVNITNTSVSGTRLQLSWERKGYKLMDIEEPVKVNPFTAQVEAAASRHQDVKNALAAISS